MPLRKWQIISLLLWGEMVKVVRKYFQNHFFSAILTM